MSLGLASVTGVWFPERCASCELPGRSPCRPCASALTPAPLLGVPDGLDTLSALLAYDHRARPLVLAVKYRNARASLATLAPPLAALVPPVGSGAVLTWAPTTRSRRRERGFDQGQLLARRLASSLARPMRPLLGRVDGPPQTGRARLDRLHGPQFVARAPSPSEVVLVDDVCTTGATLAAAATALRDAGAHTVHGVVLARTPEPRAAA